MQPTCKDILFKIDLPLNKCSQELTEKNVAPNMKCSYIMRLVTEHNNSEN